MLQRCCDHQETPETRDDGIQVTLHVYDVGQGDGVQWLNALFANFYSPLKLGGMFHIGVQIGQQEFAYGYTHEGTGVYCTPPLVQTAHHFNQSLEMAPTTLSKPEIEQLIGKLKAEWSGPSYDILRRNCCHFADALCQQLQVGHIPDWTNRQVLSCGLWFLTFCPKRAVHSQLPQLCQLYVSSLCSDALTVCHWRGAEATFRIFHYSSAALCPGFANIAAMLS